MKQTNKQNSENLGNFAKQDEKECQMKCQRDIIMTSKGPVIICNGCNRIVIDNRK
jgi:hypothetical protein